MGAVDWDPRVSAAPHDESRHGDFAVSTLDLGRISLVCLGDLAIERRLAVAEPRCDQAVENVGIQAGSARTADVLANQRLVEVGWQS